MLHSKSPAIRLGISHTAPPFLLSAKGHACCGYALVKEGMTPPLRSQLFAGCARGQIHLPTPPKYLFHEPLTRRSKLRCTQRPRYIAEGVDIRLVAVPSPQKATAVLPEKKFARPSLGFFSFACLSTFCGYAASARFVKSKQFKFGRLLHAAMDFAAVIVIAPLPQESTLGPSVRLPAPYRYKRPRDGSMPLSTFCRFKRMPEMPKISFSCGSDMSEQSSLCSGFFCLRREISHPPAPRFLLFAKSPAWLVCAVV